MNLITLSGRITKDLQLNYTQSGSPYCRFGLAVDRVLSKEKKEQAQKQGQATADFLNCVAWGKQAEYLCNYTAKGKKVLVQGSIQTGSYTNQNGQKIYTTDILTNRIEIIEFFNNTNSQTEQTEEYKPFGCFDELPYQEANDQELPF